MAIELKFHKTDDSPWGFRLTGGADCEVPLTVIKVAEGTIADNVGIQTDDVIAKINDKPVTKLTHSEVHEVLLAAGNDLSMTILRGEMVADVQEDYLSNEEICNIMERSSHGSSSTFELQQEHSATLEVSEEIQTRVSSKSSITDEKIAEVISGEAEVLPEQNVLGVNFNKIDLSESTVLQALKDETSETAVDLQNKKWSTFLQTPTRARIVPKKIEQVGPEYPPYRVIIKKQKKKTTNEILEESNALLSVVETTEEAPESPIDEYVKDQAESETTELQSEQDFQNESDEEKKNEKQSDDDVADEETASVEEKVVETEKTEEPLPLEEQLAQVQQQLQALSQLPSTIQVTLDAVTKQLAKIVRASHYHADEETIVEQSVRSEEETTEFIAEGEYVESTMATLQEAEEDSNAEDETKIEADMSENSEEGHSDDSQEDKDVEEGPEIVENESKKHIEENPTEEELEARRIQAIKAVQQEREEEFHQRRLQQRPTHPLAPLQRPIILPGGRKWSQPDDAVPVPRTKSKMTDEKISETLDTYSEVIVGHTKGINFLKYQPPPKNLDYLQNSEVFKLVHDMDPPRRGIAARSGIVASEQEYYEKSDKSFESSQQIQLKV